MTLFLFKTNDIVERDGREFRILHTDKVHPGFFLESNDDKKDRVYESEQKFIDNYKFVKRDALDKFGNLVEVGKYVRDDKGRISPVMEVTQTGWVVTPFLNSPANEFIVVENVDQNKLVLEGYKVIDKDHEIKDYQSLNEAQYYHDGFKEGNTKIYFLKDRIKKGFYEKNDFRSWDDFKNDYTQVVSLVETDLDLIQRIMVEQVYSPNGEATKLLESLGFNRADMDTGDAVQINNNFYILGRYGFRKVIESNISGEKLSRYLTEDHTMDDQITAKLTKHPDVKVGDTIRFGIRDSSKNMKWIGSGKIIGISGKEDKAIVTVEDEVGGNYDYPIGDIAPITYVNN